MNNSVQSCFHQAGPYDVGFRPEFELLTLAARTNFDDEISSRIRNLVSDGIDWTHLYELGARQGVTALLYRTLMKTCPLHIPVEIASQFEDYMTAIIHDNVAMGLVLARIISILHERSIWALPLRGPLLAQSIYGDLALRRFTDLDIMIRVEAFSRVKDVLLSMGFQPLYQLTQAQEAAVIRSHGQYEMINEDMALTVDLHWSFGRRRLDPYHDSELFPDFMRKTSLFNIEMNCMGSEDLLFSLCLHGAKHAWDKLSLICDVAEVIRKDPSMRWHLLLQRVREIRSVRVLGIGVLLAAQLLGAPVPEAVRRDFENDISIKRLQAPVEARLSKEIVSSMGTFARYWYTMRAMDSFLDSARFAAHLLTRPGFGARSRSASRAATFFRYYFRGPLRVILNQMPGSKRKVPSAGESNPSGDSSRLVE